MGTFVAYIIRAAICLTLLYLPYALLMRKETYYRLNRVVLLTMTALSFLLPLCHFPTFGSSPAVTVGAVNDETIIEIGIPQMLNDTFAPVNDGTSSHSWPLVLICIYLTGAILCLAYKAADYVRLKRFIRKGNLWTSCYADGITIHCKPEPVNPFCWMRHIVISKQDADDSEILLHEIAHVQRGHSWDTLYILFVEVLQWFNPCIWLLDKALCEVHEFEADSTVLKNGIEKKEYQLLLLNRTVGSGTYALANGLNQSLLKKRITMMSKEQSNRWSCLRVLYVLPVSLIAIAALASPGNPEKELREYSVAEKSEQSSDLSMLLFIGPNGEYLITTAQGNVTSPADLRWVKATKRVSKDALAAEIAAAMQDGCTNVLISTDSGTPMATEALHYVKEELRHYSLNIIYRSPQKYATENGEPVQVKDEVQSYELQVPVSTDNEPDTFLQVEQMPEFSGGLVGLMEYIRKSIRYPASAIENNIQGKTIIEFTVSEDGSIKDPKVVKSLEPACDNEALRVISTMPDWTPAMQDGEAVAVKYTVPINFRLQDDDGQELLEQLVPVQTLPEDVQNEIKKAVRECLVSLQDELREKDGDEQYKADFEKKSIVELATLMEKYTGLYAQYEKSGIQTFIARTIGEVIKERGMSDLYHFGDIPPTPVKIQ